MHVLWVLLIATAPNVAFPGFSSQEICEKAFEQVIFHDTDHKPEHVCIPVNADTLGDSDGDGAKDGDQE